MHIFGSTVYTLEKPASLTMSLVKQPCPPFAYDVLDEHPKSWAAFVSLDQFEMVGIMEKEIPIAAMSLVHDNPTVRMLDGRDDVLLVWDLRVHPDFQGKGYGKALIQYARKRAQALFMRHLRIETQNTNVQAVDFYLAMGFELIHIREHAYCGKLSEHVGGEHEVMLIFNELIQPEATQND